MRLLALFAVVFAVTALADGNTCVVTAPATPPVPTEFICKLPADGGSQGCLCHATVPGGKQPNSYPIGNAKCATAVAIAVQAAANDNGWSDGGTP